MQPNDDAEQAERLRGITEGVQLTHPVPKTIRKALKMTGLDAERQLALLRSALLAYQIKRSVQILARATKNRTFSTVGFQPLAGMIMTRNGSNEDAMFRAFVARRAVARSEWDLCYKLCNEVLNLPCTLPMPFDQVMVMYKALYERTPVDITLDDSPLSLHERMNAFFDDERLCCFIVATIPGREEPHILCMDLASQDADPSRHYSGDQDVHPPELFDRIIESLREQGKMGLPFEVIAYASATRDCAVHAQLPEGSTSELIFLETLTAMKAATYCKEQGSKLSEFVEIIRAGALESPEHPAARQTLEMAEKMSREHIAGGPEACRRGTGWTASLLVGSPIVSDEENGALNALRSCISSAMLLNAATHSTLDLFPDFLSDDDDETGTQLPAMIASFDLMRRALIEGNPDGTYAKAIKQLSHLKSIVESIVGDTKAQAETLGARFRPRTCFPMAILSCLHTDDPRAPKLSRVIGTDGLTVMTGSHPAQLLNFNVIARNTIAKGYSNHPIEFWNHPIVFALKVSKKDGKRTCTPLFLRNDESKVINKQKDATGEKMMHALAISWVDSPMEASQIDIPSLQVLRTMEAARPTGEVQTSLVIRRQEAIDAMQLEEPRERVRALVLAACGIDLTLHGYDAEFSGVWSSLRANGEETWEANEELNTVIATGPPERPCSDTLILLVAAMNDPGLSAAEARDALNERGFKVPEFNLEGQSSPPQSVVYIAGGDEGARKFAIAQLTRAADSIYNDPDAGQVVTELGDFSKREGRRI